MQFQVLITMWWIKVRTMRFTYTEHRHCSPISIGCLTNPNQRSLYVSFYRNFFLKNQKIKIRKVLEVTISQTETLPSGRFIAVRDPASNQSFGMLVLKYIICNINTSPFCLCCVI